MISEYVCLQRLMLIIWTVCVIAACSFVSVVNAKKTQVTTVHRKIFHFLISIVYAPVIASDITLIYFCSSVVLYGFLLLEVSFHKEASESRWRLNWIY
jgi:hypothetical protein